MFSFRDSDVDFYLPQILMMYIHMHDVAEAIHPYLIHRLDRGHASIGQIVEMNMAELVLTVYFVT